MTSGSVKTFTTNGYCEAKFVWGLFTQNHEESYYHNCVESVRCLTFDSTHFKSGVVFNT